MGPGGVGERISGGGRRAIGQGGRQQAEALGMQESGTLGAHAGEGDGGGAELPVRGADACRSFVRAPAIWGSSHLGSAGREYDGVRATPGTAEEQE